jgi:hypothetical protein
VRLVPLIDASGVGALRQPASGHPGADAVVPDSVQLRFAADFAQAVTLARSTV